MSKTIPLSIILGAVDRLSGPLGRATGKLGKFGKQAATIGKNLTMGLTLPTVALGGSILQVSGGFEKAMLQLQALSGESAEALSGLRAQARDLGGTTMFDADRIATGMRQLKLAGLDLEEIGVAIPRILDFSAASTMEFTQAAQGAMEVMKGMGLEVAELGRVTDTLMNAQSSVLVEVPQLVQGFSTGGSTAAMYGMEIEGVAAALAVLNERGTKGAEAGGVLRRVIGRLIRPLGAAQSAFEDLEISQADFFAQDGSERFLGIANAVEKLTQAQAKPSHLGAIFGEEGGPGFMKFMAAGADQLRSLEQDMSKTGLTSKMAGIMMTGLFGELKTFMSGVKELAIAIGDSGLLEWFTGVVKKGTEWVNTLSSASPETLKWGTVITGVGAAIGPVIWAIGLLAGSISKIIALGSTMGITWAGITGTLSAAGAAIASVLTAPVTLAIAAVTALGAAAYWLYNEFEWFRDAADFVGEAFMKVFNMIADEFNDLIEGFVKGYIWVAKAVGFGSDDPVEGEAPDIAPNQIAQAATGGLRVERKESSLEIRMPDLAPGTRVIADNMDDDINLEVGFALE